jgi:hypothetical protein
MKRLGTALVAVLALGFAGSALASISLAGKYKTVITGSPKLNGTWVIRFRNGTYRVSFNGRYEVSGRDSINRNKFTMIDTAGKACPSPATYKLTLTRTTLRFTRISDSCINRRKVLSHTYTKI